MLSPSWCTQSINIFNKVLQVLTMMSGQPYSTLELQSRVAPSVKYVTTNMVPTQEAIPEEGRQIKKSWKMSGIQITAKTRIQD